MCYFKITKKYDYENTDAAHKNFLSVVKFQRLVEGLVDSFD